MVTLLSKVAVDSWRASTSLDELEAALEHGKQPVFLRIWMHVLTVAIIEEDDETAMARARELLISDRAFDLCGPPRVRRAGTRRPRTCR